jgi:hypothetical protein
METSEKSFHPRNEAVTSTGRASGYPFDFQFSDDHWELQHLGGTDWSGVRRGSSTIEAEIPVSP